ncbi:MAG: PAS domain S-box protein [Proteobacteria bacterium]|nr:PAS domain S-box protein [Pseudomonadota bacterium]
MNEPHASTPREMSPMSLLAAIVDSSFDAIMSKTLDGTLISWNRAAERIFGYAAAEAIGRPITMLLPPELLQEEAAALARLARGEPIENLETVLVAKSGRRIDVSVTSSPVRDAAGRIIGASKIVRDLSPGRATARALARSESRLQGIVDSAMDAIVTVDDRGNIVLFNDAAAALFRCPADEARGTPLDRFVPERFRFGHAGWMRQFGAGTVRSRPMGRTGEIYGLRPDGSEFPAEASISHVEIDGHRLYTVIMRDVSELRQSRAERRALEAQLREAQKMEAIGTLAGGIAHDFNNIMGSIIGNVGLAMLDVGPDHAAHENLEHIELAAMRARDVVRQILAFSRKQPQALAVQPLMPIVVEAMQLLRVTLPSVVRLETELAGEEILAEVDATQIQQVLINLCTNAWHALRGSTGRIEIGLDVVSLDTAAALRLGTVLAGDHAHVWVADNGCGMDEATLARIFEPFFTTKPRGEGTGLGLAVAHGIMVALGGGIAAESALGQGSRFHLYIPRIAARDPAIATAGDAAETLAAAGERIVYIDDDELMVLMVERLLGRLGFAPTCYQDAQAAVTAIRAAPQGVDLVVTDFNMPDCTGIEVAGELQTIRPDLPVIVSSGYLSEELRESARRAGVRALLAKENSFEELGGLILRVLRNGTGDMIVS